ncbi:hypothetical protein AC578_8763 [Pseudocercospora eumusae]|uniref:BTB domain-containing protein n=1 Tax=Pseudocercospora eumusae TaxID=321146 RepID=A0A139H6A5_9PEZI|nr:hypothetical protein AC578_8763 [Pseudocercospora eumusae]
MATFSKPVASTPLSEHEWDPYGPAVLVHVGQPNMVASWKVSVSMLCCYSNWFRRMCDPSSPYLPVDPEEPFEIRLPGDDPATFGMIIHFLHNRRFFDSPENIESGAVLNFDKIIDLYAFGEDKDMPLVMNSALDLFVRRIKFCTVLPDGWATEYLWKKTRPGSKLRKCFVELARAIAIPYRHKSQVWGTLVHGLSENPDRLVYAIREMMRDGHTVRVSALMTRRWQACEWHTHEEGARCEGSEEAMLDRGRGEDDAAIGLERGGRGAHRGIQSVWDSPSAYFG